MIKFFYISNMFPSDKNKDNYGIFCKKVYDGLCENENTKVTLLSVIKGKSFNKYYNLLRYCRLMISIYLKSIFCIRNFDYIYFQYVWNHVFWSKPLFNLYKRNKKKIIINFHGEDLFGVLDYPTKNKEAVLESANLIVLPSLYYANLLTDRYPSLQNKVFVSPSGGVDDSVFFYQETNRDSLPPTIAWCSRMVEGKGWDVFIDAIEKVKEKYPNIKAVMIGYGPDYQNTIDRIKVKNLQETIDVKTRLAHSEINDIYANCLLFVSSSSRAAESLGLVSIEAMMAGVPVVGSNCAAIPEYVKDGETGFLFETNNVDDLSDKIIKFLDLPEDQKRKMANGAIAMAKNYVTENVLTQLIDTLLKI